MEAAAASKDLQRQLGGLDLTAAGASERFLAEVLIPANGGSRHFAIALGGRAIGNVGISHIEHAHGTAWMSYWLSAPLRGRGLATRGLAAAARYAYDELGLFRLELGHCTDNPASCAVAVRAAFAAEGVQRAKLAHGGRASTSRRARGCAPTLIRTCTCWPCAPPEW